MQPSGRLIIGLVASLIFLAACPSKGRPIDTFMGGAGKGRLVIYLEVPQPVKADVTITIDAVNVIDALNVQQPFITQPKRLEAKALAGRQVLLGDYAIPAGFYKGLHFSLSEAIIRRGQRKADLAYPKEGWTLEAPFEVGARDSATLFLTWDPARSLEMGFFFSPHVSVGREVRQIRQLLVYVTNEDSDTVSVVNRHTGRVVATLAVPRGPRGMATSSDGERLYVVSTRAGRITQFRTRTNERLMDLRFDLGSEPQEVAVSPDNSRLFVTLYSIDRLAILDAASLSRLNEVEVGDGPVGVVVEPEGGKVYVANSLSNDVSIVSAQTGAVLSTVSVEPRPQRLAVTRNGQEILVTGYNSSFVSAISLSSNLVSRQLNADRWITDIFVDPILNRYYMIQNRTNSLLFYEPASQLVIRNVAVGGNPHRVALDPDFRTLFVTSRDANTVTLVDRITGVVEKVLEVGRNPYDVVVVELP